MRIVNTCHYATLPQDHPVYQRVMAEAEFVTSEKSELTSEELLEFVQGADALISGIDFIKADLLAKFPPSLKVISRPAVGYDRVDIEAARRHGIDVCNAPGSNSDSVADLTLALMLMCARDLYRNAKDCKDGGWGRYKIHKGVGLTDKTVGILGLGAIGKRVAQRCQGFGMTVLAYDPYINHDYCAEHDIAVVDMDTLLTKSDFISLHLPLLDTSRYTIDANAISKMKNGVILINAARGGHVDPAALYEAILAGKVRAYGADTTDPEPPPVDYPLTHLSNVIITPHIGANTVDASTNMLAMAVENALDILQGKGCKNIVNL